MILTYEKTWDRSQLQIYLIRSRYIQAIYFLKILMRSCLQDVRLEKAKVEQNFSFLHSFTYFDRTCQDDHEYYH